jgi:hypothetical protein
MYNNPLRRTNHTLAEENLRLKKLLRENGIAWSPVAQMHLNETRPKKRTTRSSMTAQDLGCPHLPTEVILRILKFALTSPTPIIDPLSSLTAANLTEKEKTSGNQIAFHFLATCKAYKEEGERYFWTSNSFVFTSPEAVRNFAGLRLSYRKKVTHVTFRVIARYYDDQVRKRRLDRTYHRDLKKDTPLKVHMRPREAPLIRGGFRSYSWNQIIDFLTALRAPYDPSTRLKSAPRPRLLPNLSSLRLDLVNFSDTLLSFSGPEFHETTSHEFGCTLNELQVTGMPHDDVGLKASAELSGLLKDEGLYLDATAAFIVASKGAVQPLRGNLWCGRVVRACKDKDDDSLDEFDASDSIFNNRNHTKIGVMPPAPTEEGHPETGPGEDEVAIWKRVPISRDSSVRDWIQYARRGGYEIRDPLMDSDDEFYCPCCGEAHPTSSLLGLDDELDDDLF